MMEDNLKLYEPMTCDRCDETSVCTPSNDFYLTPLWKEHSARVCTPCFNELVRKAYPGIKGL